MVSEFNMEIDKLYLVHTNSGESSTCRLEDSEASTSTIANEVREDIPCGRDEDDTVLDGNSSSKGLQRRDSNPENDVVVEVVRVEDKIPFSGMK